MAATARRWSALPPDLLRRIAGRFLDTADLDYYMDFRAICRNWRAATADPKNTLESRFRPRHWVMLDYRFDGDVAPARVLVNTATGRFLGKSIPLLRHYYVISVTVDGLLVLAGRAFPHFACVLNPFTGYMVRFAAPMRRNVLAAAISSGSSPSSLVLYCPADARRLYRATPESKSFVVYKKKYAYSLVRKAVLGSVSMDGDEGLLPPLPAAVVAKIADLMTPFIADNDDMPDSVLYSQISSMKRCFLVESAGETLVIFKLENRMEVFKIDLDGDTLEPVKSIGSRAIFISGFYLGLSVDDDKFPSVEANCIYFIDRMGSPSVDMYRLKDDDGDEKGQTVGIEAAAASTNDLPVFMCDPSVAHPMIIIQLLSIYTFNLQALQASQEMEEGEHLIEKLFDAFQSAL